MRDYIIGKYLRLIYICFYQVHPENKDLLRDCLKYAYFYGGAKIDSTTLESLSIDYLEQLIGPENPDKSDDEKKKSLIAKSKAQMMERHA
jgi:hypothetical protein